MKYYFLSIEKCNLCDAPKEQFKTLGKRLNSSQGKRPRRKVGICTTIQKCSNCDLIFANPMPIPFDIQDHYGKTPESYWTNDYFKIDENYFKGVLDWVNTIQPFEKGMKALDIGAGIGKGMVAMEKAGYEVFGIEPSISFYERALDRMGIDQGKIQNVAIEDAKFDENYFDFISFGAVLEHLYDPGESIQKAMQWLKPGGLIQIEVPSAHWLTNKIINRYYRMIGTDYVANLSPMHEPYHLYEFGLKSFEFHAKANGYAIADSHYIVCDTFLPSWMDFIVKPYMKARNKGMQLSILLQKAK